MNKPKRDSSRWSPSILRRLFLGVGFVWAIISPQPISVAPGSFQPAALAYTTRVSTDTTEGRLAVFDDVWITVNRRYYDRNFNSLGPGLTWEAQRTKFRALASNAGSAQELYAILRRMLAALNDPHTRVFAPAEKFDWWRPRFVTIGLTLKEIDGLPTVIRVEPGSPPQRAGIVPGDVIESVNDQPALSLIQKRLGDYLKPGGQTRSRVISALVDGPPQSMVELRWRGKDGKKATAQFKRYWQERELGMRVRRRSGNTAIIEMDVFTGETSRTFMRSLKEQGGIRGIVLDLRGNGGGDAEAMTDVASSFLGGGLNLGRFIDRLGTTLTLMTRGKSPLIPELPVTNLPVVVLTSERTSSAAEIFVAGLKSSGRASVIGTETCGCVLAIRTRHQLPDGGLLDISELDYKTPEGERLEKNGVKPDDTVIVNRQDLYSGRDRALELAIRKLKSL